VFLNLIMNAAQAMPARPVSDNRIFVRTRSTDTRVIVEIEDNGCGMAKDVADHMFEPFFTTKPVGVGMGLGLSICHSIVAAHGGELTFETEVGKGSLFRVSLPVAPDVAVHPVNPPPTQTSERRRLRVLIVDDDLMVSRSLRMALGRQHDVEVVNGGLPAIERLSQEPLPDVVLCDLMMPDVTGADVYAAMSPALRRRFIFITGGAFSQKGAEFLQNVDAPIVQKPFDIGFVRSLIERISAL
jgi:CheY-like chemotaxis protein